MSDHRINGGRIGYTADLLTPQGQTTVYLTEAEKDAYLNDPDGFASRHFGLHLAEYREWMRVGGAPLCSARTQQNGTCGNMVDSSSVDSRTWAKLHRKAVCHVHGRR